MNFFYIIYNALCVDIFEYIFHWRSTKIPATDSSKINTFNEKVLNSERELMMLGFQHAMWTRHEVMDSDKDGNSIRETYQTPWLGSSMWTFQTSFPAWRCKFPRPPFPRGRCTLTSCCVWRQQWRAGCWPMAVRWSPTWPAERETHCTVAP